MSKQHPSASTSILTALGLCLAMLVPTVSSVFADEAPPLPVSDVPRVVEEPAPATLSGFRWDVQGWERDTDGDGLDDLISLVAAHGVDALPRQADGYLPYFAREGPSGPQLGVYVAYDQGVGASDLALLEALGAPEPLVDDLWPGLWLEWISPETAAAVAELPGVLAVELADQYRPLNQEAKWTSRVTQTATYPNAVWEDLGYTGDGVGVAVLDTGVDDEHPSLDGHFVAGASTAYTCGVGTADGINPDDDNAVSVAIIGVGLLTHHGTHVAGTILGDGAGFTGGAGMAPDADLHDVKVLTGPGLGCINAVASGLSWIHNFNQGSSVWKTLLGVPANQRISIASLSLGGGCSSGTDLNSQRVDFLTNTGRVTSVIATGNDGLTGCITSPSAAATAVSVGAFYDQNDGNRDNDVMTSFSNCGPNGPSLNAQKPDVTAPGQLVTSTRGSPVPGGATTNTFSTLSGTSMATPVVSGIIALMMEANPALETEPEMVKQILRESAEQKDSGPRGVQSATFPKYHTCWGWGQVDAFGAVKRAEDLASGAVSGMTAVGTGDQFDVTLDLEMTKTEFMNYGINGINGDGDFVEMTLDLPAGWTAISKTQSPNAAAGLATTLSATGTSSMEVEYEGNLKSGPPTGAIVDSTSSPQLVVEVEAPGSPDTYDLRADFFINGMQGGSRTLTVTVS